MRFGLFGGARARGGPAGDSSAYHDFINYVVEASLIIELGKRSPEVPKLDNKSTINGIFRIADFAQRRAE